MCLKILNIMHLLNVMNYPWNCLL